jgi:hypothetical protein
MKKFTEWMKLKELAGPAGGMNPMGTTGIGTGMAKKPMDPTAGLLKKIASNKADPIMLAKQIGQAADVADRQAKTAAAAGDAPATAKLSMNAAKMRQAALAAGTK